MDLNDAPDPSDAASDPSGFTKDSFGFMLFVGVVLAIVRLANRFVASPVENGASKVINGVTNAAQETTTDESYSADDFF